MLLTICKYIHTRTSKPRRFQINFLFNLGQSIDGNSRVSGDCYINAKKVSAIFIYKSWSNHRWEFQGPWMQVVDFNALALKWLRDWDLPPVPRTFPTPPPLLPPPPHHPYQGARSGAILSAISAALLVCNASQELGPKADIWRRFVIKFCSW